MNKRQETQRIKQIIIEESGFKPVSVSSGRGTAANWKYITMPTPLDSGAVETIESRIVEENLCGQYYTDYGPGLDKYVPEILWKYEL